MKNLKNIVAATGLMAVLGFGAVSAHAGLIISDRTQNGSPCAAAPVTSLADDLNGILLVGFPMLDGIIITDRTGLIISDRAACGATDGIIITDRDGIIITD